jgi:hypothetical protein
MKKIFFFLLLLSIPCLSQNKQVLYNFTAVPQSLMTNPGADVSYKFYFGVPLLSGVSFGAGSTSFSAYDLLANNGVDFNTKIRDIVSRASRNDIIAVDEQVELFSGGFRLEDMSGNMGYFSFGMYQEFDFLLYMPKDIAILALEGNRDYLGKSFNLGDISLKTEVLSVLHVGFHKKVNDKLILGGRAKIYSSILNATSTDNSGYISTIPGTTTFYEQTILSDLQLNTSGISEYIAEGYQGDPSRDIVKKVLLGGNLGLGFDVGLTYYPKKNIQFTASILDVGFIKHSKDVETFTYKGLYEYEGVNPNFNNPGAPDDTFQQFSDAIPLDTIYDGYTTWRPIKINSSYQYSFNDSRGDAECYCSGALPEFKNAVGAQLFVMTTPRAPIIALTGYFRRNVLDNLQMKATYTVDSYSYKNIGLGISSTFGKFNIYAMADNLLEYADLSKANALSFQFGFNFIFKDSDPNN